MRILRNSALAIVVASLLSACGNDTATPILPDTRAPRLMEEVEGLHIGEVSRTCAIYKTALQGGHGYSVWVKYVTLFFPRPEVPANGATRAYHYRGYSRGPTLAVWADCEIPASDAALARTDRFFGVTRDGADLATTQECVRVRADGTCELEGVTTETCQNGGVYPYCDAFNPVDYDVCYMLAGCGGGTWYGDPSGGTSGGWTASTDDGSGQPPCQKTAEGVCVTRPVSRDTAAGRPHSEWDQIGALIGLIKENTDYCREAKQIVLGLYAQGYAAGRFRAWDGTNYDPQQGWLHGQIDGDANGPIILVSSHWMWEDGNLMIHEGLHLYFKAHPELTDNTGTVEAGAEDDWIYDHQENCR